MQRKKQSAFTLIEVMLVVAILGILVGIGYPAYLSYLQKSRLSEAEQNIAAIIQAQEEFYLENNSYFIANGNAALAAASNGLWQAEGDINGQVHFTYKVETVGAGAAYKVTATGNAGTPVSGETVIKTH